MPPTRAAPPTPGRTKTDDAETPLGVPTLVARSAPLAAVWTGFGAAAIGVFLAIVGAVLLWIPDAAATGSSGSTVRAGVLTFLAGQRGGVVVSGVPVSFTPLGLTLLAGWLCWRAARVLAALPVVAAVRSVPVLAGLLAGHAAAYSATCFVLTHFATVGTSRVPAFGTAIGAATVSTLFSGASLLRWTPVGFRLREATPPAARAALRGGIGAAATIVMFGAGLAATATAGHFSRALQLSRGLGTGLSGLPIAVLDALTAPNAVAAAVAYLTGPGFAVGTHASFSLWGSRPGVVPGFPVLAGLPGGSRGAPIVFVLMGLMLVAVCLVCTALLRAEARRGWAEALRGALLSALVAASALALLMGAAGGSLGRHRLSDVGASPVNVWGAVFVEVLGGSLIGVIAIRVAALARGAGAPVSAERVARSVAEPVVEPATVDAAERGPADADTGGDTDTDTGTAAAARAS